MDFVFLVHIATAHGVIKSKLGFYMSSWHALAGLEFPSLSMEVCFRDIVIFVSSWLRLMSFLLDGGGEWVLLGFGSFFFVFSIFFLFYHLFTSYHT